MKLAKNLMVLVIFIFLMFALYPIMDAGCQQGSKMMVKGPEIVKAPETLRFNVSVWISGSFNKLFLYQIYITTQDDYIGFKNAWTPTENSSWVFYNKVIVPVSPHFEDRDEDGVYDAVLVGCTLLGEDWVTFTGEKLLSVVELEVKAAPGQARLEINNTDTYLLNHDLDEIAVDKIGLTVTVQGSLPTEKSEITLNISPTQAYTRQNITFTGRIEPPKAGVTVTLEYKHEDNPWRTLTTTRTDQTGQYVIVHSFEEGGKYRFRASWPGDSTHLGSTSEEATVIIIKPSTILWISLADGKKSIGDSKVELPTSQHPVNVTVVNASDLYKWRVKIRYDPVYIRVENAWLPEDNILNRAGLDYDYNFTIERGVITFEVSIIKSDVGFFGNGTIFQFNITGTYPTTETEIGILYSETLLTNSTGGTIPFDYENLHLAVYGKILTYMQVLNPQTGGGEFTFYLEETPPSTKFNVSLIIKQVKNLYAWNVTFKFNSTLIDFIRVIQPLQDPNYVFYGKESIFDVNPENAENGTLFIHIHNGIRYEETPFNGDGLLAIMELKISKAPTNQTKELKTQLSIEQASYFNGVHWEKPNVANGSYRYLFEKAAGGEITITIVSILEYWPHILVIAAALIAIYLILKRAAEKRREKILEELEETE